MLALFTAVLGGSTIGLWISTKRTAEIAERSLTELERAFITNNIEIGSGWFQNQIAYWEIRISWLNVGRTPTRGLYTHCSWDHFADDLPANFNFPDRWDGQPDIAPAFIPPEGQIEDEPIRIPPNILNAGQQGHIRIFIWGWVEYDDIFPGTQPHRTEFCNEIIFLVDPYVKQNPGTRTAKLRIVGRHVGADKECYRQARLYEFRHQPLT